MQDRCSSLLGRAYHEWLKFLTITPSSPPSPSFAPKSSSQNVLPDDTLAPPLREAGNRLLQFLQQRFGLFSPGRGAFDDDGRDNSGVAVASAPASAMPALPAPPPRSGGWDAGGTGEAGGGVAGLTGTEGLSLMDLELSEEDQPAVVPYEEVGGGMFIFGGARRAGTGS